MSAMLRPIFFIFSMFFLVFYCYVTYIAFNPNVSNEYRLYYIEKKLLHWNNGEGLSYTLGTTLDFSKNIPYLSRHGWSHKEKSSTWSNGEFSELYFDLKSSKLPSRIEIFGYPFLSPGNGIRTQEIKVFANNQLLGKTALSSPEMTSIKFEIPNSITYDKNNFFVIRIEYSNASSPKELGISSDSRVLAFSYEKIILH